MRFFTGFITSRRWAFEEMFRGLKRNAGANAFAVLLSALALTIPLWIALVFYGLSEPLRSLPTSVELTVFTKEGADAVKVANAVRAAPLVTSAQVIGKDEALKALNAQLGLPSQTAGGNPLPDIIVAVLDDRASADEIAAAAKRISALPGVDFAPYEASWHEKLRAVTQASWVGLACLGTVVALLVILVLESAVRMTTASARDEMCTLYLIGAAPGFAARPYAWRGMVLMGTAAAAALGLSAAGIKLLQPYLDRAAALYGGSVTLTLPTLELCLGFVAAAAVLGGLTSSLAALRAWRTIAKAQ